MTFALVPGCSPARNCVVPAPTTNATSATYRYVPRAPNAATATSGMVAAISVGASQGGPPLAIGGTFLTASGEGYGFDLSILDVSAGTSSPIAQGSTLTSLYDCGPWSFASDGSCSYVTVAGNEVVSTEVAGNVPLTGTVSIDSYSTDCELDNEGVEACTVTVTGTVHALASWGGASLSLDINLNYESVWQAVECSQSDDDG